MHSRLKKRESLITLGSQHMRTFSFFLVDVISCGGPLEKNSSHLGLQKIYLAFSPHTFNCAFEYLRVVHLILIFLSTDHENLRRNDLLTFFSRDRSERMPTDFLLIFLVVVVVMAFSSLARIWGDSSTIHSPPAFH